jgi:hypothetical protein
MPGVREHLPGDMDVPLDGTWIRTRAANDIAPKGGVF